MHAQSAGQGSFVVEHALARSGWVYRFLSFLQYPASELAHG